MRCLDLRCPDFLCAAFILLALCVVPIAIAGPSAFPPGSVILLRHALAPGVGDPPEFSLHNCSTQRNLDARGRAQARLLGDALRAQGLHDARVYTSRWCRCRDTARLLGFAEPVDLPALDSFFARPAEREARMSALDAFLTALPPDGPPVVLVTHQVNITALTGHVPASGGGVLLQLNPNASPTYLRPLPALDPPR